MAGLGHIYRAFSTTSMCPSLASATPLHPVGPLFISFSCSSHPTSIVSVLCCAAAASAGSNTFLILFEIYNLKAEEKYEKRISWKRGNCSPLTERCALIISLLNKCGGENNSGGGLVAGNE